MVEVSFKGMSLIEDERSVLIQGKSYNQSLDIKMSILQMAKVFGSDTELASEVDNDFGSEEYEDRCLETKRLVTQFPEISVWNKKLHIENDVQVRDLDANTVQVTTQDIAGWDNEGITLSVPKAFYTTYLKPLEPLQMSVSPFSLHLKRKTNLQQTL